MSLRGAAGVLLFAAASVATAADDPVLERIDALVTQAFYSPDVRERAWTRHVERADRRLTHARGTAARTVVFRSLVASLHTSIWWVVSRAWQPPYRRLPRETAEDRMSDGAAIGAQ